MLPIISLLIIANTINIGAYIGAMASSASLIIPQIPLNIFSIFFTIIIIIAIIKIPYKNYVRILKYLTLTFYIFNYCNNSRGQLVSNILCNFCSSFWVLCWFCYNACSYFWNHYFSLTKKNNLLLKKEIKSMRKDTAIGIGFAHLITWSIIITTAESLHDHGIT